MTGNKRTRRAASQLFRLCLADGRLDDGRVREVAWRLGESTRRGALGVLSHFRRLVRLEHEQHTALVESAAPMTDDLQHTVRASLTRAYGPDLDTAFALDPTLIGGMRIRVGSVVYDGSVRARLAALEARL